MTFHQEIARSGALPNRSEKFRLKALFSEQRALESTDQRSERDWEELAIEWHMMANLALLLSDEKMLAVLSPKECQALRDCLDAYLRPYLSDPPQSSH